MGSAATKCASSSSSSPNARQQDAVHIPQEEAIAVPAIDKRLPFTNYREWYNLKNYWKTIQRNKEKCAKDLLYRFLQTHREFLQHYQKLSKLKLESEDECETPVFENMSLKYLNVFDGVVCQIEANTTNIEDVIHELEKVGSSHKKINGFVVDDFKKLQPAFDKMVQNVLEDRYNEKSEALFQKFFSFVLMNITEGFKKS